MKRIGITCGDPSGLGPELIARCLSEHRFEGCSFAVYGSRPWLESLLDGCGANQVEPVALSERAFEPGRPVREGARLAMDAMEAAAAACREGRSDSVVTGPISKALCAEVGYPFPGQTEFFADRWGGEPTMAFVGNALKLCLSTWHLPLSQVPEALSESVFKRSVRAAVELGRRLGIAAPRVLVCGLNPHAGEGGLLGREEIEHFNPWLNQLRSEGCGAALEGCVPGDTAFARAVKGEADVVVALFHDQGLAPFKLVDFESGVNVTLGLPHLRVSPDHGTGFGIAGQGVASCGSFLHALQLAGRMG